MNKVALILLLSLLVGWTMHPYFSGASDGANLALHGLGASENANGMDVGLIVDRTKLPPNISAMRGHDGYWRLARDLAGTWWFMSPTGKLEFLNTVTTVQPTQVARENGADHYVSADWKGDAATGEGSAQDLDRWAEATLARVRDDGFKGLGAWCNPAFHRLDVPMTQDLNLWAWIDDASKRLYTSDWQSMVESAVKTQVSPLRENKNLVGYYLDNELDWGDGFAGPSAYFDHLPVGDPNRLEVVKVIRSIWPSIDEFNIAWSQKLTGWNELAAWTALPREPASAYDRLSTAWVSHVAEDYFRITTGLVRKYDPNHLILGVRFKGYAPEEVVRASRDYTDAQSLNYYVGDARLDEEMFKMMYQESNQPIVISEYSFHSLDGRSGDRDSVGFSAQVPDQEARAEGYRLMTTRLARVPYIVGADWFQWCDEPPTGRGGDGEDVNFGVVDIHDQPYETLVTAIRQTAPTLNSLHTQSAADPKRDVWRDSYAEKPMMQVPYLAVPPTLDDDLTRWPAEAKLTGMRRDQTIGLDRYQVSSPSVYMGWNEKGIYLGIEVFDNNLATAPATGWWWTRDHVEFWISTRPVSSELENYDVYCHQFFFVPIQRANGMSDGVVGQWHRDGDALKDNLIPQMEIKPVVKILKDRYIAEMFIPGNVLHDYDPVHEKSLAFNLHVRDFQTAADFFWSAPKSVQTQLRPNTWGSLYLNPQLTSPSVAHASAAQVHAN